MVTFIFKLQISVLTLFIVSAAKHGKLPAEYERCNITASEYNDCILRVTRQAFVLLRKGIPSLGVPPLNPLEITEIAMREDRGFSMTLSNVKMFGISDLELISTSNGIPQGDINMKAELNIPKLEILSDYKVGGRILILPISGNGKSNFTLTNVYIKALLENKLVEKDGVQFLENVKFNVKVSAEKIQSAMENLFNGNELLGKYIDRVPAKLLYSVHAVPNRFLCAVYKSFGTMLLRVPQYTVTVLQEPLRGRQMNIFMNENSQEIFKDIAPALQEAFGEAYKQISNRIFTKVPFKSIFLH